jgi:D-beta-D-heptose 7-phosphate kinase / D-beta-D-heptose 1-phosphate adenosyltransferase
MRTQYKVVNEDQLQAWISEWRSAAQIIVFTNGCFDLLHLGHVTLLERCREVGDKVVVGVNGDASVANLKGARRPIICECERARVLAALAATDAVTIFNEDTPLNLIRRIRPDILVKGGDYIESSVVGADYVKTWGGRVEIVPTVDGFSSTAIIERMTRQFTTTR